MYFAAALAVLLPAVAGPLLAYGPGRRWPRSRLAGRARAALSALVATIGRPATAVAFLLAWVAAVVAVFWPLGELAHRLESTVDVPVHAWLSTRLDPSFARLNWVYTALGDRAPLKVVTVVGALVFAVLWRRRFWIPLLAILASFPLEQYVQAILATMVDRGHPPTGLGTYPSGGVARIVMTFGALALFAALTFRFGRRARVGLGTAVLVLAVAEGYTRMYVQKHWLTDVITGVLFGPALFVGWAVAVLILAGPVRRPRPGDARPAPGEARSDGAGSVRPHPGVRPAGAVSTLVSAGRPGTGPELAP
ncbi:phosphatase PAP2 family protein [Krasilnikovia sp. M28-CT-15]|uniref:phosphatase PAP2 family protein n=1 Tax=Krasilnikovia sp. M28-CT-15 TaxID=3373540 RepID=UPI00399D5232